MEEEPEIPEQELAMPELPSRETLAVYLGKMLLARGPGLPEHGEPWNLVQVTEPTETGRLNEEPIMAFEVLFLPPEERDDGTYVFTNEDNEMVGAMFCSTWISPTGMACMQSIFSSVTGEPFDTPEADEEIPID